MHGAAEWFLSKWGQADETSTIGRDAGRRTKRIARLEKRKFGVIWPERRTGTKAIGTSVGRDFRWWSIPARLKFRMGSPATEAEREGGPEGDTEKLHWEDIPRSFAIAAREVTVDQFLRFPPGLRLQKAIRSGRRLPRQRVDVVRRGRLLQLVEREKRGRSQQWCYEPNRDGKYAEGMRLSPDF